MIAKGLDFPEVTLVGAITLIRHLSYPILELLESHL